jgi:hypothetical protein
MDMGTEGIEVILVYDENGENARNGLRLFGQKKLSGTEYCGIF